MVRTDKGEVKTRRNVKETATNGHWLINSGEQTPRHKADMGATDN